MSASKIIAKVSITAGAHAGSVLKFVSIPRSDSFRVRALRAGHGPLSIKRTKKGDSWVAEYQSDATRRPIILGEGATAKAAFKEAVPFWLN